MGQQRQNGEILGVTDRENRVTYIRGYVVLPW
jgi:hypothetical protein